jgi:hypothetical protein
VSVCVSARVLSLLTVHFERREREDKGEGTWAPLLICMRYFGYKVFDGKPRGNDRASGVVHISRENPVHVINVIK